MCPDKVMRLYPAPQQACQLHGLYLNMADGHGENTPHVYTNFIASLDGRIALEQPVTGERGVPRAITNPRDWRLYQELAACADVLLVSARYVRELAEGTAQAELPLGDEPEFSDLKEWRKQHGLPPQPAVVILSASLDLPCALLCKTLQRRVYVATGAAAEQDAINKLAQQGARVLQVGEGRYVDGVRLIDRLVQEGFRKIYSIAGPGVLETLLRARVLNQIYLTQVHRMLGGNSFDTLLQGDPITPPSDFLLRALYYDDHEGETCGQFFSIYDQSSCAVDDAT